MHDSGDRYGCSERSKKDSVRPGWKRRNVRLVLRTTDGALIVMTYQCLRAGPPTVVEKLDRGEEADPATHYFRMCPMFETSAPKYDWMNRIIAIGTGYRRADGPIYSIFEVLG